MRLPKEPAGHPELPLYGRGYSETGFRLECLEHLERIPGWVKSSISLEG